MNKKKYIDLDKLLDGFADIKGEIATGDKKYDEGFEDCIYETEMMLNRLTPADVEEVRHGYNKTSMNPVDEFWCSECGFCCTDYTETKYDENGDYTYFCECEFNYCPHCGAKMDKEQE